MLRVRVMHVRHSRILVGLAGTGLLLCASTLWMSAKSREGLAPGPSSRDAMTRSKVPEAHPIELDPLPSLQRFDVGRANSQSLSLRVQVLGLPAATDGWVLAVAAFDGTVTRTAYAASERDFVVDMAAGRWLVRAETATLASKAVRVDLPAEFASDMRLQLAPKSVARGQVLHGGGIGLASCAVHARAIDDEWQYACVTRMDGSFELEGLIGGSHRVAVGDSEHPLFRPRSVTVDGPLVLLEPFVLPALQEMHIRVVDARGNLVRGAQVRGEGSRGGALHGTTSANGILVADRLPAGNYRVVASTAKLGRCETRIRVTDAHDSELTLVLGK